MQLDFVPSTGAFVLAVKREEGDPRKIMREDGFDFSTSASTSDRAVLFTHEAYAACAYAHVATAAAKSQLAPLLAAIETSWADNSKAHIRCPADKELWPFQKAGVVYALARKATLIGDQPGLGKTAQAICYANELGAKRVLVICPANIRLQWVKMIREWTTMRWPYTVYPILESRSGVHPSAEWTVVSYDLARTAAIGTALAKGEYDVLILDEAHYLKTIDARRTRAVFGGGKDRAFAPLAERSQRVLALTGTPLPNRPREAYTLSRALDFGAIDWMSEDDFRERFNPSMLIEGVRGDGSRYKFLREEVGRTGELQARLRANFMVRRLKRAVMPQLKLPYYDLVMLEENTAVKQALEAESLLHIDPENLPNRDAAAMGHIAVVRHMMGLAKAPLVADYADMILDGGEEKLVVYGWHIDVLDIIEKALSQYGVVRIDGSTSSRQKQKLVEQFGSDPGTRVVVGNMQSVGTGTDGLQHVCSHALFAEASWVAGENEQCVDRLDRGGQEGQVQADFLVVPGSLDEKVLGTALRKRRGTHAALDKTG